MDPTHPSVPAVDKLDAAARGGPAGQADPASSRGRRAGERPALAATVLEGVRRRDPDALGAFFDAYFDHVYGLAYRLVGERAEAEDIAQEVFLKVHRAANRIDPSRDPVPWLVTITYNACRDTWRSPAHRLARRSSSIDDADGPGGSLLPDRDDPERRMIARERDRRVQDAVMRLPEALRAVVILHDYEGLAHDRIAKIAGASHAAIRKRYSRALSALGRVLREEIE